MDTKECKDKVSFAVTGKINITFSCEVTETWRYSLVGESTSAEKMLSKSAESRLECFYAGQEFIPPDSPVKEPANKILT